MVKKNYIEKLVLESKLGNKSSFLKLREMYDFLQKDIYQSFCEDHSFLKDRKFEIFQEYYFRFWAAINTFDFGPDSLFGIHLRKHLIEGCRSVLKDVFSFSVFILPANSRAEAFGLVLQEAMAMGLPCITSELDSGTSWLVQDGITGFVTPPRQPQSLAEAINKLLTNPTLRKKMGDAGRQRTLTEFAIAHMVARIDVVYRAVAAPPAMR